MYLFCICKYSPSQTYTDACHHVYHTEHNIMCTGTDADNIRPIWTYYIILYFSAFVAS